VLKRDIKALAGLRSVSVLEVARGVGGSYAARLLADAGADVIKIEPREGDAARRLGPFPDEVPEENASGLFHYLNAGKRSVSLNLETGAGRELLQRLLATVDVLISDYSPSELAELGLLYEQAKEHNHALIACAVTPFGLTGPYRDLKADDIVVLSLGGMTAATPGFPDFVVSREHERPLRAHAYAAGIISGATAAAAIVTALFARLLDDEGRQVDVSQQEAIASTMIRDIASYSYAGIVSGRRTEEEQSGTAYAPNVYLPCKDGMVVIVTASEDGWKKLVEVMGYPKWCSHEDFRDTASRAKNISSLLTNLVDWTKSKTGAEITRLTQSNGLPCAHVLRISEVVESDHARERAAFVELQIGGRMCRMPGPPFRIPDVFGHVRCSAPSKGKDNVSVYCGMLGLAPSDLQRLRGIDAI
jgi:crotonobetainyl-CoA:carnitine CoA-transferase CaiB-like acyl-CoA transferase